MSVPASELNCAVEYYISRTNTSEGVDEYLLNVFSKIQGGLSSQKAMEVAFWEVEVDDE